MTLPTGTPDERVFVGTDITRDATPVVYTITEDGRIYVSSPTLTGHPVPSHGETLTGPSRPTPDTRK